ncbi:MAG: hypothetical protein O2887_18500 [Bacteroidetes bacterium]|nr:hypothetical protein [Bacteroidota bacterium]MDA1122446.1 hypothetical protein [Bacteroidota bacterium]
MTVIKDISIDAILKTSFLLFICIYITIGNLPQYFDCYDKNKVELTEESDAESEQKEKKVNERDVDEFLACLHSNISFTFIFTKNNDTLNAFYRLIFLEKYTLPPQPKS